MFAHFVEHSMDINDAFTSKNDNLSVNSIACQQSKKENRMRFRITSTNTSNSNNNIHTVELDPFVDCIYRFNISHVRWIVLNGKRGKIGSKTNTVCVYVWTCVHTVMTQRLRLFTDETQIAQKLNGKMIYNVAS